MVSESFICQDYYTFYDFYDVFTKKFCIILFNNIFSPTARYINPFTHKATEKNTKKIQTYIPQHRIQITLPYYPTEMTVYFEHFQKAL